MCPLKTSLDPEMTNFYCREETDLVPASPVPMGKYLAIFCDKFLEMHMIVGMCQKTKKKITSSDNVTDMALKLTRSCSAVTSCTVIKMIFLCFLVFTIYFSLFLETWIYYFSSLDILL